MNAPNGSWKSPPARFAVVLAVLAAALVGPHARADELKDARAALAAGRYDQALALFEKVAGQGYAEGRAGVGQVHLRRLQYDKALQAFQAAEKMDANLALAQWGQGEVLRRQEQFAAAAEKLKRAIEIDRKFPDAQLAYGQTLVELGRHAQAVEILNEGLKWGSRWRPRFLVALGDAEMKRDSLRDAGIYFTTARQEAPNDPYPRRALGTFYLRRGIPALAIPEFQAAVDLDTSDVELRYALGQALYFDKRYNDALDAYRDVVQREPDFAPGQLALGNLLYLAGQADPRRFDEAEAPLARYLEMQAADPRGWSVAGRNAYYLGLRRKDDALRDQGVEWMRKAATLGDKSKDLFTVLGRALVDKKDWSGAIEAYGRGEPTTQDQMKIAQVFVFLNQPVQAESVYTQLMGADSTSAEARFGLMELGKLRFRTKDYEGALGFLSRRIALDPNSDEAYYYSGLSHKELKRLPEAAAALRQAATLAPDKADRHFWLGLVLSQLDSIPEARAEFERTLELDSTSRNAALASQQLGYRDLLAKNWNGAVRNLERSVEIYDKDLQSWVWLGQANQNAGNRNRAIECYRRALAISPGQSDAAKGLKSLGA